MELTGNLAENEIEFSPAKAVEVDPKAKSHAVEFFEDREAAEHSSPQS